MLDNGDAISCVHCVDENVVYLGQKDIVYRMDLRDARSLTSTPVSGQILCATHSDSTVTFGTDTGAIVTLDAGLKGPVSSHERADGARILSFFGKDNYSTSMGAVHVAGADFMVGEAGQAVINVFETDCDEYIAATTDEVVRFGKEEEN